eukprot:SRR837773.11699.p1 GENE.SRR837773.11699~~SRR837773.11699.p1  ORF type:complete len:216 (-),score=32.80 SRR837773.11699:46-672(-)
MGAAQAASEAARCCGGCDRDHQLRFSGESRQAYEAWSETPQQDGPLARHPAAAEGAETDCGASWSKCCPEPRAADGAPSTPSAAGLKDAGESAGHQALSGLHPGDALAERELLVDIVKRTPQDDLGMKVLHRGIGVLVVAEIFAGGAVQSSNEANSTSGRERLEVNDLIVMVNGIGGDDAAMAEECRRSNRLTLGVRRGGSSARSAPT